MNNTATDWVSFSEKGVCLFCGLNDTMYKYFQINNSPNGILNISNKLMINRKIITRCRAKDRILCFTCFERLIYCNHFVNKIQNRKKTRVEVNTDENKAICCVCRIAYEKPLKSLSANGFINNRELFLTTLLIDIKTTKEEKRIACKSCYNNMVNLCNLHHVICLTHPELRSILNRSHMSDLKEDFTFKELIILDDKPEITGAKDPLLIETANITSAINYIGSSKSSGRETESILSGNNLDSIAIDTSSSSIIGTPILGGESMFEGAVPSYRFVRDKPSDSRGHSYANAESIITDRLFNISKPLKSSQPKGTRISLPSHGDEDGQSYEIQRIILSRTELNVPPKNRKPNRFVRLWRRVFKKQ